MKTMNTDYIPLYIIKRCIWACINCKSIAQSNLLTSANYYYYYYYNTVWKWL